MAHYFTREEAEALLPAISLVLRNIQESRKAMLEDQEQIKKLQMRAMDNGHNLHKAMMDLQIHVAQHTQKLRELAAELQTFGCELKDPDMGLIDFLSLRNGREIYLCWYLGEERINFWHYLHTGVAGRQPL